MALTEQNIIDKYEIVGEFKHVQCRHARVIYDDNVGISRSFHRHVIAPGDDVSGESAEVRAICAAVHTAEIIAAYQAHVASIQLPNGD